MKKFLFILILLISSLRAETYLDGEGRFYAQEGDSLNFVKGQLLYSATRQVLTQEMNKLSLNSKLFWEKFDEKFDKYFVSIQENLYQKFKMDQEKVSAKQRQAYSKALRKKKLSVKQDYGNLKSLLNRYAVKRMSRSSRDPNSRYIRIQAQVNRRKLQQVYLKFVTENTLRTFSNLYVSLEFRLDSMSWEDTGVAIGDDFINTIKSYWKTDLEGILSDQFDRIEFTDEAMVQKLVEFSKLNLDTINSMEKESEASSEESNLSNAMWLRLNFRFKKLADNPEVNEKKFQVSSDYLLIDMGTRKLVDFDDFGPIEREYKYKDQRELGSHFASFVYQIPKSNFQSMPKKLANLPPKKNNAVIKVWDYLNLNSLLELQKMIIDRGIKFHFDSSIEAMDKEKATIMLEFSGDFEEVRNQLFSFQNMKLKTGEIVSFRDKEDPFSLTLVHEKIE